MSLIFIFGCCPTRRPSHHLLNTLPCSPHPPPPHFPHPPNPTRTDPHSRRWLQGACLSCQQPAPRQPAPSQCTPGPLLFHPALPSSLRSMAWISPLPTAPASCSFSWELPQPPQPWLHPTPCFPMPAVHHPLSVSTSTWTPSSPTPFPTLAGSTY